MANFFTADTHFGHERVLTFRPYSTVDEMDADLIRRWNSVVGESDTVYHLGDVSFRNRKDTADILDQLNGRLILVPGNHDYYRSNTRGREIPLVEWYHDVMPNQTRLKVAPGVYVELVHMIVTATGKASLLFCGHVHHYWRVYNDAEGAFTGPTSNTNSEDWREPCLYVNAGVDVWNGYPVSAEEMVAEAHRVRDAGLVQHRVQSMRQLAEGTPIKPFRGS